MFQAILTLLKSDMTERESLGQGSSEIESGENSVLPDVLIL